MLADNGRELANPRGTQSRANTCHTDTNAVSMGGDGSHRDIVIERWGSWSRHTLRRSPDCDSCETVSEHNRELHKKRRKPSRRTTFGASLLEAESLPRHASHRSDSLATAATHRQTRFGFALRKGGEGRTRGVSWLALAHDRNRQG